MGNDQIRMAIDEYGVKPRHSTFEFASGYITSPSWKDASKLSDEWGESIIFKFSLKNAIHQLGNAVC